MTDIEQRIQEEQYDFPYHHLVSIERGFSQSRVLFWGYEYLSYLHHVIKKIGMLPFASLADMGCGDGKFVYELHRLFPEKKITGIDYSDQAIAFAQAFNPGVPFIVSDLLSGKNMPASGSFDAVALIEVLEHIPPKDTPVFLEKTLALLKPGGYIIITVPSDIVALNPKHYRHFNATILTELLGAHVELETIEYLNKKSLTGKLVQRLLSNRLFILNYAPLVEWIYGFYVKHLLNAKKHNGKRILLIGKKRP